jgi:GDP-4-dehydro-6-deoxy-D-mannose reductase
VLVTGAGGFVGGHVAAAARERGDECLAGAQREGDGLRALDLLDAAAVGAVVGGFRPECIVHAAASSSWRRGEPLEAAKDELAMGRNLLEAIGRLQPRPALVCVGSAAEYGDQGDGPIAEDAPPRPGSDYGRSKVTLGGAFTEACGQAGVPLVWTRCFNLLGPGQPPSAPVANWARQVAAATDGGSVRTGSLDVVRDFIDVRDAAEILLALGERAVEAAGIINVCSGKGVALRDVLDRLIELGGKRIEVVTDLALTSPDTPASAVGSTNRLDQLLDSRELRPLDQSLSDVLEDWAKR